MAIVQTKTEATSYKNLEEKKIEYVHLQGSHQSWKDLLKPKFTLKRITFGHKTSAWLSIHENASMQHPVLISARAWESTQTHMRTEGTSSSAESYEQMGKCCYKIANLLQKSFVSLQCSCISAHLHMYICTFLFVVCMYVCMCIYTYKKLNASNACRARDEWLSMQAKKSTKRREEKTAIFSSKKQQQRYGHTHSYKG